MNWNTLSTGWDLLRILRLVLGILVAAQAFELSDPLIGLFSVFFIYQALANVSCCGVGGACRTPFSASAKQKTIDSTSFEEVK